jgi:hypothetical protein
MAQEDGGEVKRTSKLTAMISQEDDGFNGLQITVYYSENNWETCEEVNLVVDENTTINQLIDSAVYKFKTELFYENIDKKHFIVMLFKKKKKIPNDEYPACNPESKVKNYGKNYFCLVEDPNAEKLEAKEIKNEEKKEGVAQTPLGGKGAINDNKDINQRSTSEEQEEINNIYKTCSPKCFACKII